MKMILIKGYNAEGELYHSEQSPEKYTSYDNLLPSLFAREFIGGQKIVKIVIVRTKK